MVGWTNIFCLVTIAASLLGLSEAALSNDGSSSVSPSVSRYANKRHRLVDQETDVRELPALLAAANDKDSPGRIPAIKALGRLRGPNAAKPVKALVRLFQDPDAVIQDEALDALGSLGPAAERAVPAIVDVVTGSRSWETRIRAVRALGAIGPKAKAGVPAIMKTMMAKQFVRVSDDSAEKALDHILLDPNERVRWAAIALLNPDFSSFNWSKSAFLSLAGAGVPTLAELAKDEDRTVRTRVVSVLAEIGQEAAPALLVVFNGPDEQLARNAAWALMQMKNPPYRELKSALRGSDATVRHRVIYAVHALDGPAVQEILPDLVYALQTYGDAEALSAIGFLGPKAKAAASAVVPYLGDARLEGSAYAALTRMGAEILPVLREAANNEDRHIRRQIDKLLDQFGDNEDHLALHAQEGNGDVSAGASGEPSVGGPANLSGATAAPIPTARNIPGVAVIDGIIYVAGGFNGATAVDVLEAYDPQRNQWTSKAPMLHKLYFTQACALNSRLYEIGCLTRSTQCQMELEEYDPGQDRWEIRAAPPVSGGSFCGGYEGRLYAVDDRKLFSYDPASDAWAKVKSLTFPQRSFFAESFGGSILMGDKIFLKATSEDFFESLDLRTTSETLRAPLHHVLYTAAGAVSEGKIFFFGGSDSSESGASYSAKVQMYDPEDDRWTDAGTLRHPRNYHCAAAVGNTIYIIGGSITDGPPTHEVEVYRPAICSTTRGTINHANDYAVIIGIGRYRDLRLAAFAEQDAVSIRDYVKTTLGVPAQNVFLLQGEQAGLSNLAKYFDEWLPRNATADSRLYVYFSGLGAADPTNGEPFLLPWDADANFLRSTALPLSQLYRQLHATKARESIVLLDTCFASGAGRCATARGLRPLVNVMIPPVYPNVSVVFAADRSEDAGVDTVQGHGLFTYHALRALSEVANSRNCASLSVKSWFEQISRGVAAAARRNGRSQTPQLISAHPDLNLIER